MKKFVRVPMVGMKSFQVKLDALSMVCALTLLLMFFRVDCSYAGTGAEGQQSKHINVFVSQSSDDIGKSISSDNIRGITTFRISSAANDVNNFQIAIDSEDTIHDVGISMEMGDKISKFVDFSSYLIGMRVLKTYGGTKEWPDMLIPFKTLTIFGHERRHLWCKLVLKNHAPPGNYKGVLKILKNNVTLKKIPIELTVYNFSLPELNDIQILAHVVNLGRIRDLRSFFSNLRDHGVNGIAGYPVPVEKEDPKSINNTVIFLKYLFHDLSFRYMRLPGMFVGKRGIESNRWRNITISEGDVLTQEFKSKYIQYIRSVIDFFKKHGWEKTLQLRVIDEPNRKHWRVSRLIYKLLKKNFPGYPREISRGPLEAYNGLIDVWNIQARFYNDGEASKIRSLGGKVTLYYNRAFEVTQPGIMPRLVPWIMWRYKLYGYYFYSVNNWETTRENCNQENHFCSGVLVDQTTDGSIVNSIRFEQFSDGLKDFSYLRLLEERMKKSKNKDVVVAAEKFMNKIRKEITMSGRFYGQKDIDNRRDEIARLIEAL